MSESFILMVGSLSIVFTFSFIVKYCFYKTKNDVLTIEISEFLSLSGLKKYKCDFLELNERHIEVNPLGFKRIVENFLVSKYKFKPRDFYTISLDQSKPTLPQIIDKYLKEKKDLEVSYPVGKNRNLCLNIVFKQDDNRPKLKLLG